MIDTHCHIDDPVYQPILDSFIQNQKKAGVEKILVPGVNTDSIHTVQEVCRQYPDYLLPAIGLHPEEVKDNWQADLKAIYSALLSKIHIPYIAIGEIGLDYHFDTTYKQEQQQAFQVQLQWAVEQNLPVMIHCRDATEDCLRILSEFPTLQGVMHCFSGSAETAERIVKMGLYLGIGGVITFKNCHLKEHLSSIPLERIVLETDAPYMTPVPFRGKTNESRYMIYVAQVLSDIYSYDIEQILNQTSRNAQTLFDIDNEKNIKKS